MVSGEACAPSSQAGAPSKGLAPSLTPSLVHLSARVVAERTVRGRLRSRTAPSSSSGHNQSWVEFFGPRRPPLQAGMAIRRSLAQRASVLWELRSRAPPLLFPRLLFFF